MSDNTYFEEEEFEGDFSGQTLKRIAGLIVPHWKWALGFLVSIAMVSILEASITMLTRELIDKAIIPKDIEAIKSVLVLYIGMAVIFAAAVFSFIYLAGILGHRVQYDLRQKLFNHLQHLSFSYFDRTPVGWIMSRLTSDTERIADLVTWGLLDSTWAVMNILTGVYFMLRINWQLTIVVLILIPILIGIAIWFKQKILVQFRLARKINSKITGAFNENITGVRVIKALRREEKNLEEFSELTHDMYRASYQAAWLSALFLPTVQIISAIALAIVVVRGGVMITDQVLSIGDVQAFIAFITAMLWPIQDLARVYASMQQAIASAERTFSLIDTEAEIVDKPGAYDPGTLANDIAFDHVDFYYEADKPVLKDFSMTIRQGENIAIVGPTGAGKSTIVNLICRFYEPKSGVIRIGGIDYTDFTLHGIQSRIGMVLQTPHLFSGTVYENIRYGRLDATEDEIIEAARLAGAHEFIKDLDKGYDTEVGEGGVLLSVGQKQLISLARAVLAQPDIFIMDEATSSVDTLTEALIQQGMELLMRRSTSFVIAHRLSTIKRADRILVLKDGQIDEIGTHQELLAKQGHYYRLYTKQFRDEMQKQNDPFDLINPAPAAN